MIDEIIEMCGWKKENVQELIEELQDIVDNWQEEE